MSPDIPEILGRVELPSSQIEVDDKAAKPTASGQLHFDDLSPRRFEVLVYSLRKAELPDHRVSLLRGTKDQGRDVLVREPSGPLHALIQCKNHKDPLDGPAVGRFLAELSLYAFRDSALEGRASRLRIEIWSAGGFSEPAETLINTFERFDDADKAREWLRDRIDRLAGFKGIELGNALDYFLGKFRDRVQVLPVRGDDIAQRLNVHPRLLREFFEVRAVIDESRVPALVDEALGRRLPPELMSKGPELVARLLTLISGSAGSDGSDAEIELAVQRLKENKPESAREHLERIRASRWDVLLPRQRFRVLANLGHAHDRVDAREQAGRMYIEALEHQPKDEQANALAVMGELYLGRRASAHERATRARSEFPSSAAIAAAWVSTASPDVNYTQLRESLPDLLRQDPEVAFPLGRIAFEQGLLAEAERDLRRVRNAHPDDPRVLEGLALVLTAKLGRPVRDGIEVLPDPNDPTVREARELLDRALAVYEQFRATRAKARVLLARSQIRVLQQSRDEARDDLRAAYTVDPTWAPARISWAGELFVTGRTDEAIKILEAHFAERPVPPFPDDCAEGLLVTMLLSRAGPGDHERAITVIEQAAGDSSRGAHHRDFLGELLDARIANGTPEGFLTFLRGRLWPSVPDRSRRILESAAMVELGQADGRRSAELIAKEAGLEPWERRRLVTVFERLSDARRALELLLPIVPPTALGPDQVRVINFAERLKDDGLIVDRCRQTRVAWGPRELRFVFSELAALERLGDLDTAIALLSDLLKDPSTTLRGRPILRLYRSAFAFRTGRMELVSTEPTDLPGSSEISPEHGPLAVACLARGKDPTVAIGFAYELVRRHYGHPSAHWALIHTLFTHGVKAPPVPDVAGPGCAVQYKDDREGSEHWMIIEDSPQPRAERREFGPDHALSKAMTGKRVGDRVSFPGNEFQARAATITRIASKIDYRTQDSLANWETLFPEERELWLRQIYVGPDPKHPNIAPLVDLLKKQEEQLQKLDDAYARGELNLYALSSICASSVLRTLARLSAGRRAVQASHGDVRDFSALDSRSPNDTELVIMPCALATLALSDRMATLERLARRVIVPSVVMNDYRSTLQWDHLPPAEKLLVERIVTHLDRSATVENASVEDLSWAPPELRAQMIEVQGLGWFHAISLARRKGRTLWSDDRITGDTAHSLGIPRTWTHHVGHWLSRHDRLAIEEVDRADLDLLTRRYELFMPRSQAVLEALAQADWNHEHTPLRDFLERLADTRLNPREANRYIMSVLRACWVAHRDRAGPGLRQLTFAILDAAAGHRFAPALLDHLEAHSDTLFGLDALLGLQFREAVRDWRRAGPAGSTGIVIVSGPSR